MPKYIVRSGDSLSKIALKFGKSATAYRELYDLNRSVIGNNPDLIFPGQVFEIPLSWGDGTGNGGNLPDDSKPKQAGFPWLFAAGVFGGVWLLRRFKVI